MDFFEKYNLSTGKIAKILGLVLLGLVAILIAFQLVNGIIMSTASDSARSYNMDLGASFESQKMTSDGLSLSARNVIPGGEYTPGMDAENFEITEYMTNIETRKLEETCDSFFNLKQRDDVIFENSNNSDTYCNYRFKVKKDSEDQIVEMIKEMKPRYLNENIHTIKNLIDDYTSEEDILAKKLQTIENTLDAAVESYNEISDLATETKNADSLATVIESKIRIIEKLTTEKITISAQLEKISRAKAEQIDKLEYTYFNVSVYENKYIDVDQIKDSWKSSIKKFVRDMNAIARDLSVGLLTLIAKTFQFLVYLFIVLLVAKFVWRVFKRMWVK